MLPSQATTPSDKLYATLAGLNSLTKYPSIPTYHELGDKGRLQPELRVKPTKDRYVFTEKVDGTNSRIVVWRSAKDITFLIGSREEFLTARGDIIFNPAERIVETIRPIANHIVEYYTDRERNGTPLTDLMVFYGETFGHQIGSHGQRYVTDAVKTRPVSECQRRGFMLFDVMSMPMADVDAMVDSMELAKIAAWRESGGQRFLEYDRLIKLAGDLRIPPVPFLLWAQDLPTDVAGTFQWMKTVRQDFLKNVSRAGRFLGSTSCNYVEGFVGRSIDRTETFKLRFQDYERSVSSGQP